jgi:hypothetical protein
MRTYTNVDNGALSASSPISKDRKFTETQKVALLDMILPFQSNIAIRGLFNHPDLIEMIEDDLMQ